MTSSASILLLHKPYNVLCQFTDRPSSDSIEGSQSKQPMPRRTLADYVVQPNFYCAGRLDYDSEGLLLLTDNGFLQNQICDPKVKIPKSYWVQVEGEPSEQHLSILRKGVELKDGVTRPAQVSLVKQIPVTWAREKPLPAHRENNSSWLEITIREGRNRQLRRMCAAIGHPVLRLVRHRIGPWQLGSLASGEYRKETVNLANNISAKKNIRRRSQQ